MPNIPNASDILLAVIDATSTRSSSTIGIHDSGAPLLSKPSTLSQLERAMNAVLRPSTGSEHPEFIEGRSRQDTSRS